MDRLGWFTVAVLFFAFGRYTSAEERRKVRWWLARVAKGDVGSKRVDLTLPATWKPERER